MALTKKDFLEKADTTHSFGMGKTKINAIYYDWQETPNGRGSKYAVASSVENCTKAELFNAMYDWVVNGVYLPHYIYSRFAQYDSQRFKYPMTFNSNQWN